MLKCKIRGLVWLTLLLFIALYVQAQSYTVVGGDGTPLLAKEESSEKLKVFLVHRMNNVAISYTSSSSNHKWFRYKTRALDAEPVVCEQYGNTSTIRNVEEGYGYFVQETDNPIL